MQTASFDLIGGLLKLMPLWLSRLAIKLGLVRLVSRFWRGKFTRNAMDIVNNLTSNEDLRALICHQWGDIGTPPSRQHFLGLAMVSGYKSEEAARM